MYDLASFRILDPYFSAIFQHMLHLIVLLLAVNTASPPEYTNKNEPGSFTDK